MLAADRDHSDGVARVDLDSLGDTLTKSLIGGRPASRSDVALREELRIPIAEAVQTLENSGLLVRTYKIYYSVGSNTIQEVREIRPQITG